MRSPLKLPPVELLEATHAFPGLYTFKVIGSNDGDFATEVQKTSVAALKSTALPRFTSRQSDGGRHVAVTIAAQPAFLRIPGHSLLRCCDTAAAICSARLRLYHDVRVGLVHAARLLNLIEHEVRKGFASAAST